MIPNLYNIKRRLFRRIEVVLEKKTSRFQFFKLYSENLLKNRAHLVAGH